MFYRKGISKNPISSYGGSDIAVRGTGNSIVGTPENAELYEEPNDDFDLLKEMRVREFMPRGCNFLRPGLTFLME